MSGATACPADSSVGPVVAPGAGSSRPRPAGRHLAGPGSAGAFDLVELRERLLLERVGQLSEVHARGECLPVCQDVGREALDRLPGVRVVVLRLYEEIGRSGDRIGVGARGVAW